MNHSNAQLCTMFLLVAGLKGMRAKKVMVALESVAEK